MAFRSRPVPRWLILVFAGFFFVWLPVYAWNHGLSNFLWLCDMAVFLTLAGLWRHSSLLVSAAACGVLLVQVGFAIDLFGRLLTGEHPIGGTEYMFDSTKDLGLRLMSLFHLALPVVHILALRRLGYHRRGIVLMTVLIWLVLIPSYLVFSGDNLNMVVSPLGHDQDLVPAPVYYVALFAIYPLLVFGPAHLLLCRLIPPPSALVYRGD